MVKYAVITVGKEKVALMVELKILLAGSSKRYLSLPWVLCIDDANEYNE